MLVCHSLRYSVLSRVRSVRTLAAILTLLPLAGCSSVGNHATLAGVLIHTPAAARSGVYLDVPMHIQPQRHARQHPAVFLTVAGRVRR